MKDLTEKLKAGELYYVKKKNGKIVIRQAHLYSCLRTENSMPFVYFEDNDIEEVLAPVPSYEEWQAKDSKIDYLQQKVSVLESKNQRLKELLKECRDVIKDVDTYCTKNADEGYILIYRIDNAIGEK